MLVGTAEATAAVASAVTDRPLPADLVAFGEVDLGGEVRHAAQAERRLREAEELPDDSYGAPAFVMGAALAYEALSEKMKAFLTEEPEELEPVPVPRPR